jgi:hypothetical protein
MTGKVHAFYFIFAFREEEGRDLLGKRTMDFKVSYLDATFNSNYMTDSEMMLSPTNQTPTAGSTPSSAGTKSGKRQKNQGKDYLGSGGGGGNQTATPSGGKGKKGKNSSAAAGMTALATSPAVPTIPAVTPAAATVEDATLAYNSAYHHAHHHHNHHHHHNVYAATAAYDGLYSAAMPSNFQNLYPPIDNRLLSTADNLFGQYRHFAAAGGYYTDYATAAAAHHHHHPSHPTYMGNGFLDPRASLG